MYNYITNTAFDEEGNLYVYGAVGGNAHYNGQALDFPGNSDIPYNYLFSCLLAKFDTLGNMLWYKMVSSGGAGALESHPLWMEVRGDNIYITGASSMVWYGWHLFLDTLITHADIMNLPESERKPPYKHSWWTFFARLDLDGHVQERHFVESYSRKIYLSEIRDVLPLTSGRGIKTPMHVDNLGNVYLFARFEYTGEESDPYTIVIDGDTNRTIDLYLPGGSCNDQPRNNVMIYKFTPDWELGFAHLMIEETEGISPSWEFIYDSVYPHVIPFVEGISFDEQDNMYVSGYINTPMFTSDHGGNLHQYPIHIYWDSTHYATIQDMSSARRLNYLIKYNPQGEVQWCNQIFTQGSSTGNNSAYAEWWRNCLYNNYLYLTGGAAYYEENGALVYFDNETNYLQHYQQEGVIGFFVKYDKSTGAYVNHGIMHAKGNVLQSHIPACIGNRVFALNTTGVGDGIINITCCQMTTWRDDGLFLSADTIQCNNFDINYSKGPVANENGYIAVSLTARAPVTFSNDVTADCYSPGLSSAVIALYHNPEFTQPYVGIPEYDGPEPEVRLWPNPATDKITIESEEEFPVKSVAITDMQGQLLAILPVNDVRCTLNVHYLAPGTYIAHINTRAGNTDRKFVVGR